MSQEVYHVIVVALFALSLTYVTSVPANLKATLKIVNSTNIRELKHNFAAEDRSGSVAYVYPVGSEESAQSSWRSPASLPKTEAERTAVSKTLISQEDHKPGVKPMLEEGKEIEVTSEKSDSIAEKLELSSTETTQSNRSIATTQDATTVTPALPSIEGTNTTVSDNGKPDCITRVMSSDDENAVLVVYNATKTEVEAMGHEVFDTVCKGDDEWDKVISAGALASLCCGSG